MSTEIQKVQSNGTGVSLVEVSNEIVSARANLLMQAIPNLASDTRAAHALAVLELVFNISAVNKEAYALPGGRGVAVGYRFYRRILSDQVSMNMPGGTFHEVYRPATAEDGLIKDGDIAYVCTITRDDEVTAWSRRTGQAQRDIMRTMKEIGMDPETIWAKSREMVLEDFPKPQYSAFGIVHKSEKFSQSGRPEMFDRKERAKKRAFMAAVRKMGLNPLNDHVRKMMGDVPVVMDFDDAGLSEVEPDEVIKVDGYKDEPVEDMFWEVEAEVVETPVEIEIPEWFLSFIAECNDSDDSPLGTRIDDTKARYLWDALSRGSSLMDGHDVSEPLKRKPLALWIVEWMKAMSEIKDGEYENRAGRSATKANVALTKAALDA